MNLADLGRIPYREAWGLQKRLQQALIEDKLARRDGKSVEPAIRDFLLLVEHPHVYTLGKSGNAAHLLKGLAELKEIDAEFVENDRGGDITYHGPGQIVGYPILDLDRYMTDIHLYLRTLEEVIIRTAADMGVEAGRVDGLTGVWVGDKKICAMGIRCSRWVTMHGFALNVHTDLTYFDHIVPCGIRDRSVGNLADFSPRKITSVEVKERLCHHFSEQFGARLERAGKGSESDPLFSYLSANRHDPDQRLEQSL